MLSTWPEDLEELQELRETLEDLSNPALMLLSRFAQDEDENSGTPIGASRPVYRRRTLRMRKSCTKRGYSKTLMRRRMGRSWLT